jgi:hypothetical protein
MVHTGPAPGTPVDGSASPPFKPRMTLSVSLASGSGRAHDVEEFGNSTNYSVRLSSAQQRSERVSYRWHIAARPSTSAQDLQLWTIAEQQVQFQMRALLKHSSDQRPLMPGRVINHHHPRRGGGRIYAGNRLQTPREAFL